MRKKIIKNKKIKMYKSTNAITTDELIKLIEKAKKNNEKLTKVADKSKLSPELLMKIGFCKHFVRFLHKNSITLRELSELTSIPITRLSEITNYKINKFTLDQLLKYLAKLAQHSRELKEYLVFLGKVSHMETTSISETKRLINDINKIKNR